MALEEYLSTLGVDIEKPFELSCIDPDDDGTIEYLGAMYVIMGNKSDFVETNVSGISIFIEESHPMTGIQEEHFVIGTSPLTLSWTMGDL
ncbi:MAG: hypothetical protein IKZ87_03400 [Actinomycetaceae bacterium]|nr:hypothetical protein [Actinomycetaceae bacterium]